MHSLDDPTIGFKFDKGNYLVDGILQSSKVVAIQTLYEKCVERKLLPQLFRHMGVYPDHYLETVELATAHKKALQNQLILNREIAECACKPYNRMTTTSRTLLAQTMIDEVYSRFPIESKLRIMVLGAGRMAEVIFLTSLLFAKGFNKIEYAAVEPDESNENAIEAARDLLATFKNGGLNMDISIEWHKSVGLISKDTTFHLISAVDINSEDFQASHLFEKVVSHLDERGCAIFGLQGLNFQISSSSVELIPPYIEDKSWYDDWVKRCDQALAKCGETLTVLMESNFDSKFFPLVYLVNSHQKGHITLIISDKKQKPPIGIYAGIFSRISSVSVKAHTSMETSKMLHQFDIAFCLEPITPLFRMTFQENLQKFKSPSTIFTYSLESNVCNTIEK